MTSFYCPAVTESCGSRNAHYDKLNFRLAEDFRLYDSVLCMIADRDLVFGRCRNKKPHSSGILLCRVVVVGYKKQ